MTTTEYKDTYWETHFYRNSDYRMYKIVKKGCIINDSDITRGYIIKENLLRDCKYITPFHISNADNLI